MPQRRYAKHLTWTGLAVCRNVFALIADTEGYEGEVRLQSRRATYKDIKAWVRKNYGLHVSHLAISWTKDRCGLAKTVSKECGGPQGPYESELTPEKEAAIREAFKWFGLIEDK